MNINELCKKIIRDNCVKPVKEIILSHKSTVFYVNIYFADDTVVERKLDMDFQNFILIMQNIQVEKTALDPRSCFKVEIGYNNIFGFVSGDTACFTKEGLYMPICFL